MRVEPDVHARSNTSRRAGIIILLCGLAASASGVALLIQPAKYCAWVRIKIVRSDPQSFGTNSAIPYGFPYPIQTEFEVIQSEVILHKVVAILDLNNVWGRKYSSGAELKTPESAALIKRHLDLRPIKNTSLIDIRFTSEDPVEAARLAATIAEVFRDHYLQKKRQLELAHSENVTVDVPIILENAAAQPVSPNRAVAVGLLVVGVFLSAAGFYFLRRAPRTAAASTSTALSETD